jgi:CRISPR-associated protein Cmr4
MSKHLLTLYTRTPLHVGCGTSVDVVDLPIMRERITNFPVIPGSSLKGVLLQRAREFFEDAKYARSKDSLPAEAKVLFGAIEEGEDKKQISNAGCVQIMEAKLLAFPVRSLAGCFAWLTCPAVLARFQRDTGKSFAVPQPEQESAIAGGDLIVNNQVVLEEYALAVQTAAAGQSAADVATALKSSTADPLWTSKLDKRLAIVSDELFQHFVSTCTEVVTRVKIDPATRTVDGGALFNQENVPCEALFYSVLTVLAPRQSKGGTMLDADALLKQLLPEDKPPLLQIGGDETTGHGICETKREELN